MMKTLVIIILFLLVLGLYYAPDSTKGAMKATGHAGLSVIKYGIETIKESGAYANATETAKGNFSNNLTAIE